jgi:N-acetylmuramoyl-L-alanine amidase
MADRGLARFLAPLALMAVVAGVILVVVLSTVSHAPAPLRSTHSVNVTHTTPAKPKRQAYTVKTGDSLTAIAVRTGVSVDTLERLNPDADPQALHVGERLKLRP